MFVSPPTFRRLGRLLALTATLAATASAQIGTGWIPYSPTKKIHLDDESGLRTFNWTASKSVGIGTPCADYTYDAATDTETFRILDNRSNRSEIRLQNEYSSGLRQFEGFVTFDAPLNDESLFQIFGSTSGATLCMLRGYSSSGGTLRVVGGIGTIATGVYGLEQKVNVIHDQNNTVQFYVNGTLKGTFNEAEAVSNYHKYGCYGTLRTPAVTVKWRRARSFRQDAPPSNPGIKYEAEDLPFSATGAGASVVTETTPSGGQLPSNGKYVSLAADGVPPPPNSEYIDFVIPNVPAGTYDLFMRYKTHQTNRGILRLSVDGVVVGSDLNEHSSPATFRETLFGVVRFPADGSHVVRLSVMGRDATSGAFTITADTFRIVRDETPPEVTVPDDITLEATGPNGAVATYTASAVDDKDGPVPVTFNPASGSVFPLGTSTVIVSARDASGNVGADAFEVAVVDTTAPTLNLPADLVLEAWSPAGAVPNFTATADDLVTKDIVVSYSHAPDSYFPLGTTVVTATAQDAAGNSVSGTFTVTVRDTTAPVIEALGASQTELWPANHRMVDLTMTARLQDIADTAPTFRIVSITSNEPVDGAGDGSTSPDWAITGDRTFQVRAERAGSGDGRIYTITIEAVDASGNTSTRTTEVRVAHDKSGK